MSDIDAVIDLLEKWRDATGVGRLRIGVDASRVIAQLPAARKRALAVEVAERVAPQLVPAIESESGDLTGEQVGALVDLLRRADREQLNDLVVALRTGDVGGAAGIVGDAVDVVAGPDDETDALLDEIATGDADLEDTDLEDAFDDDAVAAGAPADGTTADDGAQSDAVDAVEVDTADQDGATGTGAGLAAAAATAAAGADAEHVEIGEDGSLELDEEAVRQRLAEEAAQRAEQYRDSSAEVSRAPAYRAPAVDFISDDSDLELPDTTVESVPPIQQRIDRSDPGRPSARRLAAPPVTAVVASLTATPDGYRRRRAALAAVRDRRLEADQVVAVVRSFDRATDRAWVAGAAVDAGLVGPDALEEMDLSPAAIRRLEHRAR